MRKTGIRILPPLLAGAALGALTVWALFSRTLALGLTGRGNQAPEPPAGEVWTLEATDGIVLHAYASEAGTGKNWVILLHSRDGAAGEMTELAEEYRRQGWSTLVPDMRGSGMSGGAYQGLGLGDADDLLAWMDRVREHAPEAQMVLHGVSTGASAALCAAGTRPAGLLAVVADSVPADLWTLGERELTERFHGRHLLLEWGVLAAAEACTGYDLRSSLRRQTAGTRAPILFLYGEGDDLVPADMAESLCRCAVRGSRLLRLPCGRGEGFSRQREAYLEAVFAFLTDCSGSLQTP